MAINEIVENEEIKKIMSQQNYYSQLKFMSIKPMLKNKQIIIKKSIPSNMFKTNLNSTAFDGSDKVSEEVNEKLETTIDIFSEE